MALLSTLKLHEQMLVALPCNAAVCSGIPWLVAVVPPMHSQSAYLPNL